MAIETMKIDPRRSEIRFSMRHLVISEIAGRATRFTGTIRLDRAAPTRSVVEVVVDAASLDTGDLERDEHIRSPEFLDAKHYPEIRFESRRVSQAADGGYRLAGVLTIRDASREVSLEITDGGRGGEPRGWPSGPFKAHGTVDRREFGLRWNQDLDTGGVVVGDKIRIDVSLVAFAAPATAGAANPGARA